MHFLKPAGDPKRIGARRPTSLILFSALMVVLTSAAQALQVDQATLKGSSLRLEGSAAGANSTVTVTSTASAASSRADRKGRFRVEQASFSAPNCGVTVSDGTDSVAIVLSGCTPSGPPPNQLPNANAGPNILVVDQDQNSVESVTLTSASSDPDGFIVNTQWSEAGIPLATGTVAQVVFSVGVHVVELTVTDNDGAIAVDTMTVTVDAFVPPPVNQLPNANAGPNIRVVDQDQNGIESVTLTSASSDPDGFIANTQWSEAGIPLATGTVAQVVFSVGVHVVELTVTDNDGDSAVDMMTVTVDAFVPPPVNQLPNANAGPNIRVVDQDQNSVESVTLTSASSDPDGFIVNTQWSEAGIPLATGTVAQVVFSVGVHVVELTVTDNDGA
ncbi:MAG TPA: hypothetical protein EYP93_10370, partial [Gammaproteobacteria bacterium]|nr:hypothetical protein [Gammaproteobacteria bacterium]